MKTLITALALAALVAAPSFTPSAVAAPNDVIVGGKYVGSDPDPGIQLQLRRDVGSEGN